MKTTIEEKLMYEVMNALYNSGIPINFKGSLVLKAWLEETGYSEETRHTVDIDANWHSDVPPTAEQMTESFKKALAAAGIPLDIRLYRMYGERRSAGFEFVDRTTGEVLFTMDIDVNRPMPPVRIYQVENLKFCGVAPLKMLADKTLVASTDKIFRRIKDLVDLYYLSGIFEFDVEGVRKVLVTDGRVLGDFNAFISRKDDLQHSYEKFRFAGDVEKPAFEQVYETVKEYISGCLPE